jgi:hypothetical protein
MPLSAGGLRANLAPLNPQLSASKAHSSIRPIGRGGRIAEALGWRVLKWGFRSRQQAKFIEVMSPTMEGMEAVIEIAP